MFIGLLALSSLSVASAESGSTGVPESLLGCVDESDDKRRLACFDREMAKLGQAEPMAGQAKPVAGKAEPAPAMADPVDAASSEEKFGIVEKSENKKELTEISAKVVKVSRSSNRIFTIWLDNDQAWRQKNTGSFQIYSGDAVTITKGNFGGFHLKRRGRSAQVIRVK